MSLHDLFIWLGQTGAGRYLASSTLAFALTESIHLLSIGVLAGAALATDLAVLRVIFRNENAATIARGVQPLVVFGLAGAIASGVLLVAAGPMKYYTNPLFPLKLGTLAAGIVVQLLVYLDATGFQRSPSKAKSSNFSFGLAGISIVLWVGVAVLGRWLGLI